MTLVILVAAKAALPGDAPVLALVVLPAVAAVCYLLMLYLTSRSLVEGLLSNAKRLITTG